MIITITATNAWVHGDMMANICNATRDNMSFEKTRAYQADTADDSSAKFNLPSGSCHTINFWIQWQSNGWDIDDQITFIETSKPAKGQFNVKVVDFTTDIFFVTTDLVTRIVDFNMPNYVATIRDGVWSSELIIGGMSHSVLLVISPLKK